MSQQTFPHELTCDNPNTCTHLVYTKIHLVYTKINLHYDSHYYINKNFHGQYFINVDCHVREGLSVWLSGHSRFKCVYVYVYLYNKLCLTMYGTRTRVHI